MHLSDPMTVPKRVCNEARTTLSVSIRKRLGLMNLLSGFRFIIGRHCPVVFFGIRKEEDRKPETWSDGGTRRTALLPTRDAISSLRARRFSAFVGTGVSRMLESDRRVLVNSN